MTRSATLLAALLLSLTVVSEAAPLRIFIRAGEKTHGPNQHDHPRFLAEWQKLLTERGAKTSGAMDWPTAAQFAETDVVVVYAADPWDVTPDQKANIEAFTKRGGGIVVIHDGLCGHNDPQWVKSVIGGSWTYGKAKWFEGDISMYYVDNAHPITKGASNFDLDDEMYYDLDFDPAIAVLATTWTPDARALKNGRAYPSVYTSAPQIWALEKDGYRAFVSLPGHNWKTFELPQYRAVLLRGIAWAGHRENIDELCLPEELGSLRYPRGGPSRPADELAKLVIHPSFNASLVAAEPVINKAIAMDWDAKGRLWVAETPEYPNGRRGMKPELAGSEWKDHGGIVPQAGKQDRPGRDKISILIDSQGTGTADKKVIFYEGLELVTGFVFYKDGVIVTQAPDILWLRDTTGAGKADKVEVLYHGLGTQDTHAVINNPRWGMDGWIYATHGYSSSNDVTSGDGKKHFGNIGSGVIRFKPDGSAIEQYSSKGGNTWGLAVTPENDIMWTQATSGDLLMETLLPERTLAKGKFGDTTSFKIVKPSDLTYPLMTWEQQAYRQIDWVGHFTAATGCAIYDGGTWPAEWDGSYFTTEPTINLVHHSFVTPQGVSFTTHKEKGREETEFMVSRDMWFRPIQAQVGPDGALYVIDFYNQAVIHNDTRGPAHNNVNAALRPDRDHYFGRIWRVDHKEAKKLAVPDLSQADAGRLVETLAASPNEPVRKTAARLLRERNEGSALLAVLAGDAAKSAPARIEALWILHRQRKLPESLLLAAIGDKETGVARNALKIAAEVSASPALAPEAAKQLASAAAARLSDPSEPVELSAILALGGREVSAHALALAQKYISTTDPWLKSAVLSTVFDDPLSFLRTAGQLGDADKARDFISRAAAVLAAKQDPALAAEAVKLLAAKDSADFPQAFHGAILGNIAAGLKLDRVPAWTPELHSAFDALLHSKDAGVALPLLNAWDREGSMTAEVKALIHEQLAKLQDSAVPEATRGEIAASLIGARNASPEILPAITALLTGKNSEAFQRQLIVDLGKSGDAETGAVLIKAYPGLSPSLQGTLFAQILKRADWTRAFIEGLKSKTIDMNTLGTIALDKLRHYPDGALAQLAAHTLDAIRGPMQQKKDEIIAKLLPVVEKGGDPARGKQLFLSTCSICHKFNGEGANLAPDLTGMGSHPRAALLVDIVDPNREVDPSFAAFDFAMKNGDVFQGIISRENAQTVLVRDAAGDHDLVKSDIASRRELGRSLMPEGFEALGAETLRDILAYIQSVESKYHIIDMRTVFDADSRRGLFSDVNKVDDTLHFKRFGAVKVGDVPFVIADPAATGSGNNLLLLRGGMGHAKTYPQRVELQAGHVQASALNFLGGVGGWAFPCCGDEKGDGLPAAKVTVFYEGGGSEDMLFKNGEEFADFVSPHEVPGSKSAAELVNGQQVRVFRKTLAKGGVIEKLAFESFDNRIAPVFVSVTAESDAHPAQAAAGQPTTPSVTTPAPAAAPVGGQPAPAPASKAPTAPPPDLSQTRILAVGGGSSHDFKRWFGDADKAILEQLHPAWLEYTEKPDIIPSAVASIDVLVLSTNQPISSEARKGIFDAVKAGKGLVLIHPALWYNWANFPEYNRELVGGGAHGHDRYGEFEVEVVNRKHPVTAGLPEKFKISDELYNFIPDLEGTPIEVLAQATSPLSGKTFPQVWIVKHPTARIVCITLGHDGAAHDLPEYKLLLQNAVRWAAGK